MIMGVQARCPSGNLKQSGSDGGIQQVPKPVVNSLSKVNNCKRKVSWEEQTLGEPHVPVDMAKRTVKIIVTARLGT